MYCSAGLSKGYLTLPKHSWQCGQWCYLVHSGVTGLARAMPLVQHFMWDYTFSTCMLGGRTERTEPACAFCYYFTLCTVPWWYLKVKPTSWIHPAWQTTPVPEQPLPLPSAAFSIPAHRPLGADRRMWVTEQKDLLVIADGLLSQL